MDLTNMIPGGAGEEKTPQQQLSKEEYAAMKKQQREEVWAEVDAQAQAVFQNGDSLKGFLDFMAQCNMLWSSIFVTLMANKIGGLQFGIYRNCQISSRVFHTAVAALPLTKANRSDFE